jgi:hypothetical protein
VVAGGDHNTASAGGGMVAGGQSNTASGVNAMIVGGTSNTASGTNSLVGGVLASSNNLANTFVWSDGSTATTFDASTSRQFSVLASNGIRLFNTPISGCIVSGGTINCTSDRNVKTNIVHIDGQEVLARLRSLPLQTYTMIAGDPSIHHLGPMAQDFYAAFGLGENDRAIATIDLDGVSLASIQALDTLVQEQDARIATLEQERDSLQARLDALDARLAALERPGTGSLATSGGGPAAPATGAAILALAVVLALPGTRRVLSERVGGAIQAQDGRPMSHHALHDNLASEAARDPSARPARVSSAPPASARPKGSGRKRRRGSGRRRGR